MRITADCAGMTVNEVLIVMYTDEKNTDFHTLRQWNEKGYSVNKGATAFVVWGKPKATANKQEQSASSGTDEDDEDDSFFPLCYLFSNAQVSPRKQQ